MGKVIVFAGNVGSGKTTIARALAGALGFEVHFESVSDNPFLEDFYHDQRKWAYHLQTFFLIHRFTALKEAMERGSNIVFDRSIYEDAEIFARNLYETGKMEEREFETYLDMFYSMMRYIPHPDLLVFIDADIDTILARIRKRGRNMELEVPIAYWQQLSNLYDLWINRYDYSPVYRIDAKSVDIEKHPDHLDRIVSDVKKILKI